MPGALMRKQQWSWKANDQVQVMCMVVGIDWDRVAEPGYDTPQGLPRNADRWFKGPMIRVREPNGDEGLMRIPQNIQQQTCYGYYEGEDQSWGLVSGVAGGNLNEGQGLDGRQCDAPQSQRLAASTPTGIRLKKVSALKTKSFSLRLTSLSIRSASGGITKIRP